MQIRGLVVAVCALSLALSGCGLGLRGKGSAAVAGFLAAVHRGDRTAFEAAVDRPALRADLGEQLAEVGRSREVDIGGASEFALDRMINLQAVRAINARVAPGWPDAPTAAQVTPRLKVRDVRHICLEEAATKHCLLSFALQGRVWRLVGMQFKAPPGAPAFAGAATAPSSATALHDMPAP